MDASNLIAIPKPLAIKSKEIADSFLKRQIESLIQ